MRKLFTISLMTIGLTAFTFQVNANCSGTSVEEPVVLCGITEAYQEALDNCCEGNIIYYEDACNNVTGTWTIGESGPNADCPPT